MATYVQWFRPDEGLWCYDERWSTRHLEMRAQDQVFVVAASLAEFLEAGDRRAVIAVESRYGVVPDAAFPNTTADDEPLIEPITAERFEQLWGQGREQLARPDNPSAQTGGPSSETAIQSDDPPLS